MQPFVAGKGMVIKMKKTFTTLLLLSIVGSLLTGCTFFNRIFYKETSIERVERLTGYDLPNDMEELYYFQQTTFGGCAGQYSVYTLNKEPLCISNNKTNGADKKLSSAEITRITDYLDDNNIPREYYPDFEQAYSYITGAENTYIIYFPEEQLLKIWMWGH